MAGHGRILVVDDEPVVNESCRRVLHARGFDVETTESGQDGLSRAAAQDFDLIITDLKMPDLDGMELIRRIRRERPHTAIVVITGFGTVGSAVEAVRLGVSDYIEKPFTPKQLSEAVSKALAPAPEERKVRVEADLVKDVLRRAAADSGYGRELVSARGRVLSGMALSSEAKAAIVSGDIAWVEKECGELSPEERAWLEQRLQAEVW
jgi:DNA-binding NtrC family response regulator